MTTVHYTNNVQLLNNTNSTYMDTNLYNKTDKIELMDLHLKKKKKKKKRISRLPIFNKHAMQKTYGTADCMCCHAGG